MITGHTSEGGIESYCLVGMEFSLEDKKVLEGIVVMVAQ